MSARTRPSPGWAAADLLFLLMFAFGAVVQVNDPDPLVWIAIYGLAAAACILSLLGRGHWAFPAGVAVLAAAWAAGIAPRVIGQVPFMDMFGAFEMRSEGIEESREMYGLYIIAAWTAVLAVRWWRRRGGGTPAEPRG